MTRFARARGSKASNLKAPDDSTPWEVMKEQMVKSKKDSEESKNREEAEKKRIENYQNFLKEQKTQKRKSTWCEFPEAIANNKISSSTVQNEKVKKKRKKLNNHSIVSFSEDSEQKGPTSDYEENKDSIQKKKDKKKKSDNNEHSIDCSSKINENENDSKVKLHDNDNTNLNKHNQNSSNVVENDVNTQQSSQKKIKKKKNKKPKLEINADTETEVSLNKLEKESNQLECNTKGAKTVQNKKEKKKKKKRVSESKINAETGKYTNNTENNISTTGKTELAKKNKDKIMKGRRKPINDRSFQLIINAKEVQLIRFDGFPVMKKDAERLEELKKSMIKKGIPKSEVQRTMKLERRRAEKALARLKREVCYNCRKGGHNLSDCPDLKSVIPGVSSADGVCFKCGSTEHRQFECKVQRDKEFRFATCFICKESGHIARQCPDNPKGLYPNGGCCKLCGDVTHLRKDCPTVTDKKEGASIKLQTLNDGNIEDIDLKIKPVSEETSKKPKKIKF